jgi:two-component system nitrate/nitrite response regulator NarL
MTESEKLSTVRLLVVDDHALVRKGLVSLLKRDARFNEVREAADVNDAVRVLDSFSPDLILLDNHLPGVRGIDSIPIFKELIPFSKILMLTISGDEDDLSAALLAGADGYLLKTIEPDQLCDAISRQLDGDSVVSPELMSKLINLYKKNNISERFSRDLFGVNAVATPVVATDPKSDDEDSFDLLTARERQILVHIAKGDGNKLIARELDIAETTVKIHVQHILRKLKLHSRVQVAVYAVSKGIYRS